MNRPKDLDLFLYLRKSRLDVEEERKAREEGREHDTLARHLRNLMEVVERDGHVVIETFREVVTGESIVERTEIQRMLKRMDNGDADAVLVMDIDRLGRGDMYDSGILDRAFRYNNVKIITPSEVYDPEEENWELVFGIKTLMARNELKTITKRLQGGRRDKAKLGRSISKKPPYGYLRDEKLKLYPDPDTSWVVQKMFQMMRDGFGRQAIAAELDKLGIKPPNEKRKTWSPSTITAIIKNEVYLGHIIWGKITYSKRGGKYKRKKMLPSEWIRKDNAHNPLVSQELWDAANLAHTGRFRPSTITSKTLANPLAGILKCAVCGFTMQYQPRKDRPNDGIRCYQPGCRNVQKGGILSLVEERILHALDEYVRDIEVLAEKEEIDSSVIELKETAIENKQKDLTVLNEQKNNLHDLLERGVYDAETFNARKQSIQERINVVKDEIQQLEDEVLLERAKQKNVKEFAPAVRNVIDAYHHTDDIEKKNRLLKSVIEKATFLRKKEWVKKDQFVIHLYPKL